LAQGGERVFYFFCQFLGKGAVIGRYLGFGFFWSCLIRVTFKNGAGGGVAGQPGMREQRGYIWNIRYNIHIGMVVRGGDEGVLLPASVTYVTEAFFLRQRDVYILGTGYFRGGGLLRELGRDGKGRFLLSKPSTPPPSHNRGQRILAKFAPLISSSRHKVDQSFEGCWNRGAQVPPWRTMY